MKKLLAGFAAGVFMLCGVNLTHATLIDNGDGTITQLRDDGTALMWMSDAQYASKMTYFEAASWVNSLDFAGHDDWRLPSNIASAGPYMDSIFGSYGDLGGVTELGNLRHFEMGIAYDEGVSWGGANPEAIALFSSLSDLTVWTEMEIDHNAEERFVIYDFSSFGEYWELQWPANVHSGDFTPWAVRDVSSPIPEPATMLLFGTGLAGLVGSRVRRKKKA